MRVTDFKPLKNQLFCTEMDEGVHRTAGGIILRDDQGSSEGIRPRWAKVAYKGEGIDDVEIGEWVLIEHGRWAPRMTLEFPDHKIDVWKVDQNAILLVSDHNMGHQRISL